MHSLTRRDQAISLRRAGYGYGYIAKQLGLSKSTLSGWLSDIPFHANEHTLRDFGRARAAAAEKKARKRLDSIKRINQIAQSQIGQLTRRDLFMFGLGLYVGEGTKTHNTIRVINADPRVIVSMVSWFKSLEVDTSQFDARIYLYPDSDIKKCLHFWSKTTRIPLSQFAKPQIDRRLGKKAKKRGRLPYGTMHLGIRSRGRKEFGTQFFWKILAWNDDVLKKAADVV